MIKFENVSKEYGKIPIFKNISFDIEEGGSIAFIGPSGVGKTTIGRMIAGLETQTSGKILIDDLEFNPKNLEKIRNIVGFVFQDFKLFHNMTVIENIIYSPVNIYKLKKDEAISKANDFLRKMNLLEHVNKYPHQLSGGQKQRVAIIRALMINPRILIFDEPTASLDKDSKLDAINSILDIKKMNKITIIVITHDQETADLLTERRIIFSKDGIVKK